VPAGAVQYQQCDAADGDAATDLGQVLVRGFDIDLGHDDGGTGAALRTDRAEQPGPIQSVDRAERGDASRAIRDTVGALTVRSIANSMRRTHSSVSTNVRQKSP
jgi:hypothetical protein